MAIASIEELYEWRVRRNGIAEILNDFAQPSEALMRFIVVNNLGPIVSASRENGEAGTMKQVETHATDALYRIRSVNRSGQQFNEYDLDFVHNRLTWLIQSIDEWIAENS